MAGILLVVLGYGLYQPAAYTAVRQFTTPVTAAMGYAMLYALMNLGGWLPSFFAPIRKRIGIAGAIWVYVGLTVIALVATWWILSRRTVEEATARARAESGKADAPKAAEARPTQTPSTGGWLGSILRWLKNHPMADPKFSFFIFALIPVQTLFAHNWLTLPMYVERAYRGTWTGDNFEVAVNFNPLLIFILVPVVTALSQRAKVYHMMIAGTAVMAAPTFLLVLDAVWFPDPDDGGRGDVAAAVPAIRRRDRAGGTDWRLHGRRSVPLVPHQDDHEPLLGLVPRTLLPGAGNAPDRENVVHLRRHRDGFDRAPRPRPELARQRLQNQGGLKVRGRPPRKRIGAL
jgi:MFS family permease